MFLLRLPLKFLRFLASLLIRVIGVTLGLLIALFLLVFIFFWILLRLLTGRKPQVDVSTHFSRVRIFSQLGGTVFRPAPSPQEQTEVRRPVGPGRWNAEVEDVQARELPKGKN